MMMSVLNVTPNHYNLFILVIVSLLHILPLTSLQMQCINYCVYVIIEPHVPYWFEWMNELNWIASWSNQINKKFHNCNVQLSRSTQKMEWRKKLGLIFDMHLYIIHVHVTACTCTLLTTSNAYTLIICTYKCMQTLLHMYMKWIGMIDWLKLCFLMCLYVFYGSIHITLHHGPYCDVHIVICILLGFLVLTTHPSETPLTLTSTPTFMIWC